jgi:hypothetical protein
MNVLVVLSRFSLTCVSVQVVAALRRAKENVLSGYLSFHLASAFQKRWDGVLLADDVALKCSINAADGVFLQGAFMTLQNCGSCPDNEKTKIANGWHKRSFKTRARLTTLPQS